MVAYSLVRLPITRLTISHNLTNMLLFALSLHNALFKFHWMNWQWNIHAFRLLHICERLDNVFVLFYTSMLVTFGICFKQHFDILVFYNTSPPRMFFSLDLLWEYRIQHGANGPLYVIPSYSTWIFCRGVSGFATECPCGVWCRGLNTCLLHVGPHFGIIKKPRGMTTLLNARES